VNTLLKFKNTVTVFSLVYYVTAANYFVSDEGIMSFCGIDFLASSKVSDSDAVVRCLSFRYFPVQVQLFLS
jgi:hypothetical protein